MRRFRTGIGRLTAPMLNGVVQAVAQAKQTGYQVHRVASTYTEAPERLGWVLAKITGNTAISGATNRWEYDWEEVEPTASAFQAKSGGYTSSTKGKAWNLCESFNDGGTAGNKFEGPGWNVYDAPAGFDLRAITGEPVVQLWLVRGSGGVRRYVFSLANVLDGACP